MARYQECLLPLTLGILNIYPGRLSLVLFYPNQFSWQSSQVMKGARFPRSFVWTEYGFLLVDDLQT
jgi:hypothetical protein